MNAKLLRLVIGICLMGSAAQAFNGDRCGNLFPKVEGDHPPYYSPFYVTTMFPSTTSYFTSTGHCAMYGSSDSGKRALFVHDSMELIAQDAAKGSGDYITALANLSGCGVRSIDSFGSTMKKNYSRLFANKDQKNPENFLKNLDSIINSETELKSCRVASLR